ncbi:hypothetical protein, partial [Desulfovibrio piger]
KAGLVRYISELQKMVEDVLAGFSSKKDMRKRQEERVIPDGMDLMKRLSLSFVKNSRPKTGRQASGKRPGCRTGRQGPDGKVLERRGGMGERENLFAEKVSLSPSLNLQTSMAA